MLEKDLSSLHRLSDDEYELDTEVSHSATIRIGNRKVQIYADAVDVIVRIVADDRVMGEVASRTDVEGNTLLSGDQAPDPYGYAYENYG
jgi:hypothetical protein